jgi:anion transporter
MSSVVLAFIVLLTTIVVLLKEILSIGVVGIMLPFVAVALGFSDTPAVMSCFINESVVLIPCVYVLGEALFEVGIADRIGGSIKRFSDRNKNSGEKTLLFLFILAAGLTSFFLPRYGVTGALMPVAIAIARSTKISRTKLLLALAMAANIWGNNTLMSTPPNMLANGVLENFGAKTFGFFEFALIGMPIAIGGTMVLVLAGKRILPSRVDENALARPIIHSDDKVKQVPPWKISATYIIFALFILGIMFEKTTRIQGHIVGMACVAVVLMLRILSENQAIMAVGWGTAFFCGGILVLGDILENSGAGASIAGIVIKILGDTPNPFLIVGIMFSAAALMTQFMSNTGAAGILFPIGASIAASLNADPRAIIMAVVMGCGASFMTPLATPSNTMVMTKGEIQFSDFAKAGTPLLIVTSLICILGIPLIWPFY